MSEILNCNITDANSVKKRQLYKFQSAKTNTVIKDKQVTKCGKSKQFNNVNAR